MASFNHISFNPFHPKFIPELKKKVEVIAVPLNFLYAKFFENFWISSDIPDFNGTFAPALPPLIPEITKINEIALTSPNSPLAPGLDNSTVSQTSTAQFFGTLAGLVTKVKGIWPLIPPFLYEVINSEEKHLQNIKVEITAATKKKIYQIEFGKIDGEGVGIAIEVTAGEPIKFMHDKSAANSKENFIHPIFPTTSLFSRIWKRQEPHTECIITVEDPGNLLLKDAQITHFIPLSEHEGFKIVHRDPTVIKNPFGPDYSAYDYFEKAENSEYVSLSSVSVKLADPMPLEETKKTEIFSLPFGNNSQKSNDYFLEITQYQ